MIWLTWRQHRAQALFALVGLAVLAAVLVPTGRQMYDTLADTGLERCLRGLGTAEFVQLNAAGACQEAADRVQNQYGSRVNFAALLMLLPLLVGLFWGAPLVAREVEHGTHRLVWTQGVTRLRWALAKLGLVLAGTVLVATAYALLMTWWLKPLALSGTAIRFDFGTFDLQGVAPIGYTLFAVALGVFAGTVTRKVMPAMAVTLVGFAVVRFAVAGAARPRFQGPEERRFPITTAVRPNPSRGDWILSDGVYDDAGNLVESNSMAFCDPGPATDSCNGYNGATYQPGSRFWPFQYIETGLYLALAAVLLAFAVYRVRRRLA